MSKLHSRSGWRPSRALIGLVVAGVAFGIASAVYASVPDSAGVIHACYKAAKGKPGSELEVLNNSGKNCQPGWTELTWNGAPQFTFMDGPTIQVGSNDEADATATCPSGKIAVAGGFRDDPQLPVGDSTNYLVDSANQGVYNGGPPNGTWWVRVYNDSGSDTDIVVTATCSAP